MTGLQNKTDSLSFYVDQLGCFIDLKINAGTKGCERVWGNTGSRCNKQSRQIIMYTALQSQRAVSAHL